MRTHSPAGATYIWLSRTSSELRAIRGGLDARHTVRAWQKGSIAAYMATHGRRLMKKIDPSQRAVPDVSAYDEEINQRRDQRRRRDAE